MSQEPLPAQGPVDVNVRHRPPVADRYAEAVTLPNGELENFTIRVEGERFHCSCGCNVFHKPDKKYQELYECNGCEARYEGA